MWQLYYFFFNLLHSRQQKSLFHSINWARTATNAWKVNIKTQKENYLYVYLRLHFKHLCMRISIKYSIRTLLLFLFFLKQKLKKEKNNKKRKKHLLFFYFIIFMKRVICFKLSIFNGTKTKVDVLVLRN